MISLRKIIEMRKQIWGLIIFCAFLISSSGVATAALIDCNLVNPGKHVVGIDISKNNQLDYLSVFITDMENSGHYVGIININNPIPACVNKIVIGRPQGKYTSNEANILYNWVSNDKKGLMINAEHTDFYDVSNITSAFGVTINYYQVTDSNDFDTYNHWPIYQIDNFVPHPILKDVIGVEMLAGSWFSTNTGTIIRTDNDDTASPQNVPVAVALSIGQGRVAIFDDTNWIDSTYIYKHDNRKMATNTIAWLDFEDGNAIPEFPTMALPIAAVLGMMFLFQRRKAK